MKLFQVLLFFSVQLFLAKSQLIEIEDGLLEGIRMTTRKGVGFNGFFGIPYAEPPIGSLRFQPPVAKRRWSGVLNATAHGPGCMQSRAPQQGMSEDCLHLSVFTKNLQSSVLKPVIVYIHGGAFEMGTAAQNNPSLLLDRDVVLVTINYRIGPFGFLALGTREVVGNMALKDQVMALRWVQRNIRSFGGNPNLVTISGLSAGGHSVAALLASNMARNLFHRAIAMSGSITWQKSLERDNIPMALEMAAKLNCPLNVTQIFSCFSQRSAQEIINVGFNDFYNCPVLTWTPVVEPDFGQERFFTEDPNNLFRRGDFLRVPIITGITADEFVRPLENILTREDSLQQLNENFTQFAPICFNFGPARKRTAAEVAEIFRNHYLPFDRIDRRAFNSLALLLADGTIGYGVHRFAQYASRFTDLYYYKFSYIGRESFFHFPRDKPYGVHHIDDNQYIMGSRGQVIQETDPENIMVERMTRIWEQFAHFGNPNNPTDEFLSEMIWPRHNTTDEYFLDIGTHLVEKQGLYLERFFVWDHLDKI